MTYCEKDTTIQPLSEETVLIIGHGGGGDHCHDRYDISRTCHNRYSAIKEGLSLFEGIEVDVQVSKDSVIYVGHDTILADSSYGPIINFLTSHQIDSLNSKYDSSHHILSLEQVIQMFLKTPKENAKLISLDIKNYYHQGSYWQRFCKDSCDRMKNSYRKVFALSLKRSLDKHPKIKDRLAVEGWDIQQLEEIHRFTPEVRYKCLVIRTFTPDIQALLRQREYVNCISKPIETTTKREFEQIRDFFIKRQNKDFLIQLWTATDSLNLRKAKSIIKGPATIQADKYAL
ncbi:MAG: hypothetical protein GXO48_03320 [Chlorobi bacterium]|nr:hypothetical protein [Chlorobiota bacterium]